MYSFAHLHLRFYKNVFFLLFNFVFLGVCAKPLPSELILYIHRR